MNKQTIQLLRPAEPGSSDTPFVVFGNSLPEQPVGELPDTHIATGVSVTLIPYKTL